MIKLVKKRSPLYPIKITFHGQISCSLSITLLTGVYVKVLLDFPWKILASSVIGVLTILTDISK